MELVAAMRSDWAVEQIQALGNQDLIGLDRNGLVQLLRLTIESERFDAFGYLVGLIGAMQRKDQHVIALSEAALKERISKSFVIREYLDLKIIRRAWLKASGDAGPCPFEGEVKRWMNEIESA